MSTTTNASVEQTVKVDFGKITGRMKPLHGVNNGPKTLQFHYDMSRYFVEAGIPYSRLHDTEYPFGSGHFVDIPCLFPDFDADPDDPASYRFTMTDDYIKAILAVGTKVFYRLGVSIEHQTKKLYIFPPKDNDKWARICAGVIRHYNEGWADGFHYGIDYWEIWNEPENPPMWQGTKEEYFRLYVTTANHLKAQFPAIKVGGYAGCGFYALTRKDTGEFHQSFVSYFTDFLKYISAPEHKAPLDFYSWHLYTINVEEMVAHAAHVEKTLAEYGFPNTESIINEWNYVVPYMEPLEPMESLKRLIEDMKQMKAAAFVAAVFCALQSSAVDMGAYYDAQSVMPYCGLFDHLGPKKPYYSFKAFNALYALGDEVSATTDIPRVYVCAASSGAQGAILLCNYDGADRSVTVDVSGFSSGNGVQVECQVLDEENDLRLTRSEVNRGAVLRPVVSLANNSVVLLRATKL